MLSNIAVTFTALVACLGTQVLAQLPTTTSSTPPATTTAFDFSRCPGRNFSLYAITGSGAASLLQLYGVEMTRNGDGSAPPYQGYSWCYQNGNLGLGCSWFRDRVTYVSEWVVDHSDSFFSPYISTPKSVLVSGFGCTQQRQLCTSQHWSVVPIGTNVTGAPEQTLYYYLSSTRCSQLGAPAPLPDPAGATGITKFMANALTAMEAQTEDKKLVDVHKRFVVAEEDVNREPFSLSFMQ